jgi:hypothetical protein
MHIVECQKEKLYDSVLSAIIFIPRKFYYVLIFPYGIYFMEYFFRCNGNFIIHMEKILHEIDSIWKNDYIIKFPWNKYYAGTN